MEVQGLKLDLDSAFALVLILALLLLLCRLDEFMDKHFQLSGASFVELETGLR